MGGGSYSSDSRLRRMVTNNTVSKDVALVSGLADSSYRAKSREQIFGSRELKDSMNPNGVTLRESRDSEEHPNSVPIIIALDVTGSMGNVPEHLVREGLPHIMEKILEAGIKDPQVLFLAIGDHECDRAPLQVGQFESSDELLDKWLTDTWLEGHGGGNNGESYGLAWFFAGKYTEHDAMNKRGQKGILFTIGDEPNLRTYPERALKNIMGTGQFSTMTDKQLYEMACEKYDIYHIHIQETGAGRNISTIDGWKQLLQDNLILAQKHQDVSNIIAAEIVKHNRTNITSTTQTTNNTPVVEDTPIKIML
jgi:hypothetical protein